MPAADRSLDDVVAALLGLRAEEFTHDRIGDVLGGGTIRESSWRRRVGWRDDRYARHLIHRTDLFSVLLLCWKPGQVSPVHNHQGNSGWVRVLRGRMEETHYQSPEWVVAGVPMPGDGFEIDDDGVGHGIELRRGLPSWWIGRSRSTEQTAGPAAWTQCAPRRHVSDEPAITLHVYSRPHDSCLAFDVESNTCRRLELKFDSVPA